MSERTRSSEICIVGDDPGLRATLERARRVAPAQVPVLVTGESGTGKELVARLLHERGPCPTGPLVTVNCGALARELAESELFGHERGAFTGAGGRRVGWFEEANDGTLVLDEIGELPLDLQPKLLRVLETGRLRRVGGQGEVSLRVRVVAMTLRDLGIEIVRGAFRTDLYHRLAGIELRLPPLRRRPGDIEALAVTFLAEAAAEVGPRTLGADALTALRAYGWPGNIRELRNVIRRAALLCLATHIDAAALDLPRGAWDEPGLGPRPGLEIAAGVPAALPTAFDHGDEARARDTARPVAPRAADPPGQYGGAVAALPAGPRPADPDGTLVLAGRTWEDIQRAVIAHALRMAGGSRRKAARALGVSRSTLAERARRLGIVGAPCG